MVIGCRMLISVRFLHVCYGLTKARSHWARLTALEAVRSAHSLPPSLPPYLPPSCSVTGAGDSASCRVDIV